MPFTQDDLLLVTGATGLVGSHVVERARREGVRVRALVRPSSNIKLLQKWDVEWVSGGMTEPYSLKAALTGVTHVVHCAALVGDWGPTKKYRQVNVEGLESFLEEARQIDGLKRFVHISSLGVYPARDHYGTDEAEPTSTEGIDAYTLSKVEAEDVVRQYVKREKLPVVVLRPGFIYGPRDRTVLPRIIERLRSGKFAYIGDGTALLNNTYVGNLMDAVFLALQREGLEGQTFNITDGRLVSKREFIETIVEQGGFAKPTRHVPLGVAKALAAVLEWVWGRLGMDDAPLLSKARVKFLGLNLDFAIDKARRELGYNPQVDFADGMKATIAWFREKGRV